MSRLWRVFAGNRAAAVMLTVLMHLLALLIVTPWEPGPRREPAPLEQLQGVWIRLDPMPPPATPEPEAESETESGSVDTPPPRAVSRVVPRDVPRMVPPTAITLPPANDLETPSSSGPPRAGVDWRAEAAKLGGNYGAQEERVTLAPPRERMRKPCKPPERSFKFKHEEESTSKGGMASLTMGWEEPPPDKHFFDDMKQGKTPHSSVPDPDVCD